MRVGNIWYPENQKKIADKMQRLIQLAFISEKQKMARIYRPTGKPARMPVKLPNKSRNCGHNSHCGVPLMKDINNDWKKHLGQIEVCKYCRCDKCTQPDWG